METATKFEVEEGPHKGWKTFKFEMFNRPWSLLTIDDGREEPHSLISVKDNMKIHPWPSYDIRTFKGVLLTPQSAATIIELVHYNFKIGKERGADAKLVEIRKALGC